ncbi:uncharacterized protein BP5553_04365 [Venustampulla echinocandica]|uniref:AB hydrolase-1 domain-containing protein n=1 Tax=Venustampulla echinocandica TaxID=2656787 RepID=A0A370TN37_9HELO|nr:uncharacterized protein BP5553_04365 [Venustampulla echinocandica]RDL36932.1 hypothetical protein BP5553_04365 [Venustampulla echinocandica]
MSTSIFRITEHVVPGQHIREYPNGTRHRQEEVLKLAVKQYTPLDSGGLADDDPNAVTIIGGHANGFGKEIYEPLWDDLYLELKKYDVKIRNIWIADMSHQGASGVLNEAIQGDDASWFDHSRDLLQLINHFRAEMQRPLVGIAHSMGCAQLVNLSIIHPRLLTSLILIEPVIQAGAPAGPNAGMVSTFRPDLWPSREAATESFRKNKVFQAWDSRVLEKYITYCLRELPTAIYPNINRYMPKQSSTKTATRLPSQGAVTLTTSKHQEAWSYVRPSFHSLSTPASLSHLLSPDLDPSSDGLLLSHRGEPIITLRNLPHVRPSVLYIFGSNSPMSTADLQTEKLSLTGSGIGGSGGTVAGNVQKTVIAESGHLVACEHVTECANATAEWLAMRMKIWREEEQILKRYSSRKSKDGKMLVASKEWKELVRKPTYEKRPARDYKL